jgi:hypothetical protein
MTGPHGGFALLAVVLPEVLLSLLPKNVDYTQRQGAELANSSASWHVRAVFRANNPAM